MAKWSQIEGSPLPLGVTWIEEEQAYNFAVYSEHAENVTLLLYDAVDVVNPRFTYEFDFLKNKSNQVWHCRIPIADMEEAHYYAYRVAGQNTSHVHSFDSQKILLDPYAQCIFFPANFDRTKAIHPGSNAGQAPLGVLTGRWQKFDWAGDKSPFHESNAIIYEVHVKGFTKNPNSGIDPKIAGTYAGLIEKIPYLKDLGVTIVELMPVFQLDPQENNYWGYMTLNFFAPHAQYASASEKDEQHIEFKKMVKALHEAGIEVVLDVVYNHTCEGNVQGPIYSYKGFDNSGYYMLSDDPADPYLNYSGTGNTFNFSHRQVRRMVLDSLNYWKHEMHVDGFRFDLASVFSRSPDGPLNTGDVPIFSEIAADPDLSRSRLIAEPWDAGGAYQLGYAFPGLTWLQWNGQFRDDVRRFVKSDTGMVPILMRRLYGSDDLFPDDRQNAYHAFQSVNFIASHDGFTLYDLVSYNQKRNWANGNKNEDGMNDNYSWNCGHEGDYGVPAEVATLRRRQVKNFCCLLLLSNGTPMFRAGDEFLNTQSGNNNPYNQDNKISWLNWDQLKTNQDIFRFFKNMIAFRKAHPSIGRSRYWREDVSWYGVDRNVDLDGDSHTLAYCLRGASQNDQDLYVMINAYWEDLTFNIQEGAASSWRTVVDTNKPSPNDFLETSPPLPSMQYRVGARSIVVLVSA
jgi:glycogen operon protein